MWSFIGQILAVGFAQSDDKLCLAFKKPPSSKMVVPFPTGVMSVCFIFSASLLAFATFRFTF